MNNIQSLRLLGMVILFFLGSCASERHGQFHALTTKAPSPHRYQQQWDIEWGASRSKKTFKLLAVTEGNTFILMNALGQRLATYENQSPTINYYQVMDHPALAFAAEIYQCAELYQANTQGHIEMLGAKWRLAPQESKSQLLFSGILRATIEKPWPLGSEDEFRCTFVRQSLTLNIISQRLN